MFITLQQLERNPVRFDVALDPGEIDFDAQVTQVSPLQGHGAATLVNHALGEIRVQGRFHVSMSAACDRCLDAVALPLESGFDLIYMPAADAIEGEDEVEEAGTDIGYYQGAGLELNDVLREVVLLALPMQVVCRESCKGICPVCGQNRNGQSCDCHLNTADDRWSKLRDFRPRTA